MQLTPTDSRMPCGSSKFQTSNSRGFTIVELIVVVSVIAIFSIIVISNFSSIKLQFSLSRVAYKFDQDVRKAQNLASSAIPYTDEEGVVQPVNGYGVYIDINGLGNKKYIIYADKPDGTTVVNGITYPTSNQIYDALDYIVETVDFSVNEPGVIINKVNNVLLNRASINFNSSDLFTNIFKIQTAATNSVDIVFALESDQSIIRTVTVNFSGASSIK